MLFAQIFMIIVINISSLTLINAVLHKWILHLITCSLNHSHSDHICPLGFPCDSSNPSDRFAASNCSSSISLSSGFWLFWSTRFLYLEMNSLLASATSFLGHICFDNWRCCKRSTKRNLLCLLMHLHSWSRQAYRFCLLYSFFQFIQGFKRSLQNMLLTVMGQNL